MDYNYLDPKTNPFVYNTKFPQRFIFIILFVFLTIIFLSFVTFLQFQKYISFKIAYISTNFKQIKNHKNKQKYLLQKQKAIDENSLNSSNLMLLQSSTSNVNISPLFDLYLDKLDYEKIKGIYDQNSSRELLTRENLEQNNVEILNKYRSKSPSDLDDIKEEEENEPEEARYNVDSSSSGEYLSQTSNNNTKSADSHLSINIIEPIFTPDKIMRGPSINVITNSNSNSANSVNSNTYNMKQKSSSPLKPLDLKKEKKYFANMNTLPGSMNNKDINMNPFVFKNSKLIPKTKQSRRQSMKSELKTINEMDPNDLLFEVLNHK